MRCRRSPAFPTRARANARAGDSEAECHAGRIPGLRQEPGRLRADGSGRRLVVDKVPVLGSGKLDYVGVADLVREQVSSRSAVAV